MKLIHKQTGKVVREGDKVTDFRGEPGIVLGWTKPRNPASTGRIAVEAQGIEHYCYPEVYFCEWINREDRLEDEQIALGVLKDPISIGDPTQAIYGFTQPTPVGGFAKPKTSSELRDEEVDSGFPSVSSSDQIKQLVYDIKENFFQIQESLNQIKTLLS